MYKRVILVAALALVGCQSAPEPTPTPTDGPSSSPVAKSRTSTPTPTPTETTAATSAPTAAELESFEPVDRELSDDEKTVLEAWREYLEVVDWFLRHPDATDYTDVQRVTLAGSEAAESTFRMLSMYREQNWELSGQTAYRDIDVHLTESAPMSAVVTYCFDASANEVLDADSREIAVESEHPTAMEEATLQQLEDRSWRVVTVRNEVEDC